MTIGIFGGTFDPPHICHVLVCQYVLCMSTIERIIVIPSARHPFDKGQTPYAHRLRMCQLAMEPLGSRVEVSEIESMREGYSYTVDTLRELHRLLPDEEFRLIIGSDILAETDRWKEFEEVKRLAPLLVVPRAIDSQTASDLFTFPSLSSTAIRNALCEGADISTAIQPAVYQYIQDHHLYRS